MDGVVVGNATGAGSGVVGAVGDDGSGAVVEGLVVVGVDGEGDAVTDGDEGDGTVVVAGEAAGVGSDVVDVVGDEGGGEEGVVVAGVAAGCAAGGLSELAGVF